MRACRPVSGGEAEPGRETSVRPAGLLQREAHQFKVQQSAGLPKRGGRVGRVKHGTAPVHRERFLDEVQRHGVRNNPIHTSSVAGGGRVMVKKQRAVGLLGRAKIAVQGMVQQFPPSVDCVAPRCQDRKGGAIGKKAVAAFFADGRIRVDSPQNLRARLRERQSGPAGGMDGRHPGIIGKKNDRHTKLPYRVLLCRWRHADFRVRPAMFLEPESFGFPCPFGGGGSFSGATALSHGFQPQIPGK